MSEQDRGAYAPQTDAPLAFDARQSRGGGGGPAPLTLLVSAIVLMAMLVGLLLFYRHGVRHAGQTPELVGEPVGQTKSAPSDAAVSDQAAGLQVYKTEATPSGEAQPSPSFAAPPEQPAPLPTARPAPPPLAMINPAPLRGAASPPPAPAAPRSVAAARASPPSPAASAPSSDASYVAGSAFAGQSAPPPRAPAKLAAADRATKSANAAAKLKPAASVTQDVPTPVAGGGAMVQIGAFSSAALAQQGWSDDAHATPAQMAGKTRKVEMASKDGKTFYRAYVGGFATRADAAAFCAALKAKAKPCFVK